MKFIVFFFVVIVVFLFLVMGLLLLSILFLSPWKESFHKYVFHLAFSDRALIVEPVHILMWKTMCSFPHLKLNCSFHECCMEDGVALWESNGFFGKVAGICDLSGPWSSWNRWPHLTVTSLTTEKSQQNLDTACGFWDISGLMCMPREFCSP